MKSSNKDSKKKALKSMLKKHMGSKAEKNETDSKSPMEKYEIGEPKK